MLATKLLASHVMSAATQAPKSGAVIASTDKSSFDHMEVQDTGVH